MKKLLQYYESLEKKFKHFFNSPKKTLQDKAFSG